jgi:stearoyl-CoA desaturase (delta-9 desaturase)
MESQWFYRWLQATWPWHVVGQFAVLFALGGLPAMVWGGALRMVWVYHITWFVNSASHVWGYQTYNTGDLSRNNWYAHSAQKHGLHMRALDVLKLHLSTNA